MVEEVGDAGTDVDPLPVARCPSRGSGVTALATGNGQRATYNRPMKRLLLALALLVATTASAKIEFIEDDYTHALARAKKQNVPLFVEAWAPW